MILEQHYLDCLSQASYLLGDESTGTAVVVDPRRDVELYLERAAELGLEIKHVFLTHFHADFVSGHLELQQRTGAEIHLGAAGQAEYAFTPAREGDRFDFGQLRIEVLETPGHTPESVSLVVYDLAQSAEVPRAVLTGDALFVGDVGRPDLMASVGVTATELAEHMYDSLHGKLMKLPDETLVYPGHGAGSMCGKALGKETFTTIGAQREHNWALQPKEKQQFVAELTAGQPAAPAYFAWDAGMNRKQRGTLDQALETGLTALSGADALRLANQGHVLLDVRHPDQYAPRHLAGSINIGLNGRFASWCGTVLDPEAPIVLIAEPGTEREAAVRLGRVGFDRVVGYLEGGAAAFDGVEPSAIASHPRIDPDVLAEQLAGEDPPRVLDVRMPAELENGFIPGASNAPLQRFDQALAEVEPPLEPGQALVVQCQGGYRSSIAASLLERKGFSRLQDLRGGWAAWEETRVPK